MHAQGVADPTMLPVVAQGANATSHQIILEQLVTLIQAETAKAAADFSLAHGDATLVFFNAE